jgi:hypothetical protein
VNDPTERSLDVCEFNPMVDQMEDSRQAREGLFNQELNEVVLLIDYISGRSDRSLSTLTINDPEDHSKILTVPEVINAISSMRYPTPPGAEVANARNAAILLLAKDQLSYLAAPVRGLTIAYTAMFVDAEAKHRPAFVRIFRHCLRSLFRLQTSPHSGSDSRIDLATKAFPAYQDHAISFAIRRSCLGYFTVLWFVLTLFTYWDAALGRSALERLDQTWKTQLAQVGQNPLLMHCTDQLEKSPDDKRSWRTALTGKDTPEPLELGKATFDCRQYNYARALSWSAGQEVRSVFQCEGLFLPHHMWCWPWILPSKFTVDAPKSNGSPKAADAVSDVPDYIRTNATYWQSATLRLTVFTSFILPMMFGLLGALIGGFRAIALAVSDNELAPRDLVRMHLGIPIGLVAGVAVALFLSPSTIPVQGSGTVSGELTLTASGLGFLAGYAAERFFRFIDTVSNVVLPDRITPAPRATVQQTHPGATQTS